MSFVSYCLSIHLPSILEGSRATALILGVYPQPRISDNHNDITIRTRWVLRVIPYPGRNDGRELTSRNIGIVHPQFDPFRSLRTALLATASHCDSLNPMDRVCLPPSPAPPSAPSHHLLLARSARQWYILSCSSLRSLIADKQWWISTITSLLYYHRNPIILSNTLHLPWYEPTMDGYIHVRGW
jgi:hypothetical protein